VNSEVVGLATGFDISKVSKNSRVSACNYEQSTTARNVYIENISFFSTEKSLQEGSSWPGQSSQI
jgi:hypothetical protein